MIAGGLCTFYGMSSGLGALTLLRPLLDAISPLSSASIAMLCTMAALAASLVGAAMVHSMAMEALLSGDTASSSGRSSVSAPRPLDMP